MKSKEVISLLGCGWLGFPLSVNLISKAYKIKASSTSPDKLAMLKAEGIDPYLVQFNALKPDPDLHDLLHADILIISVPPGGRSINGPENYRKMADVLKSQLAESRISRLILISSTSVYADSNSTITESSEISPDTLSGSLMAEIETILSSLPIKVIILRLAGLIGPGRSPGRFFAGKSNIPNGLAPVNLIHLDDAVNLITCLIETQNAAGIYNGCAPSHPTKAEFYTLAAKIEQLEPPSFLPEKVKWKVISSERTGKELNFSYKFPSLMDWLHKI